MIAAVSRTGGLVSSVLAQRSGREAIVGGLVWLGVFFAVAVVAAWLLAILWRRFITPDNAGKPDFTLEQLKQLRDQGELTAQQYECLKEKVSALMSTRAV